LLETIHSYSTWDAFPIEGDPEEIEQSWERFLGELLPQDFSTVLNIFNEACSLEPLPPHSPVCPPITGWHRSCKALEHLLRAFPFLLKTLEPASLCAECLTDMISIAHLTYLVEGREWIQTIMVHSNLSEEQLTRAVDTFYHSGHPQAHESLLDVSKLIPNPSESIVDHIRRTLDKIAESDF